MAAAARNVGTLSSDPVISRRIRGNQDCHYVIIAQVDPRCPGCSHIRANDILTKRVGSQRNPSHTGDEIRWGFNATKISVQKNSKIVRVEGLLNLVTDVALSYRALRLLNYAIYAYDLLYSLSRNG